MRNHPRDEFDTNNENLLRVDRDACLRNVDRLDKAGTTAPTEVVGGDLPTSKLVLNERSGVRGHRVRGVGGDDDLVYVIWGEIGVLDRHLGSRGGQGRSALVIRGVSATLYAGALGDPLISGIYPLGPVVVGYHPLRRVPAEAEDVCHRRSLEPSGGLREGHGLGIVLTSIL